ncbi:MAG: hypothetical protein ACRBDL_03360 [Alphaproteobacteria bacterium]
MDSLTNTILIPIVIAIVFMVLELFILSRWIEFRRNKVNALAWAPFRKMMLDSIVRFADEMVEITDIFEQDVTNIFVKIKKEGKLSEHNRDTIEEILSTALNKLIERKNNFYYIVQTVAPSIQPYVAQYTSEVMWFNDALESTFSRGIERFSRLENLNDIECVSKELNGVNAVLLSVKMFRDGRFYEFKPTFTQSVWKKEELYYYEEDNSNDLGEFLHPNDYAIALDMDKAKAKLNNIPRTMPVKSFFDLE